MIIRVIIVLIYNDQIFMILFHFFLNLWFTGIGFGAKNRLGDKDAGGFSKTSGSM